MKLRFTITDLLVFMTALAVYIAVVTQAKFILWHLAAASGLMGLLVGTVIGACYGGRQRAVWAGIIGALGLCIYATWTNQEYRSDEVESEAVFGIALCAFCGAVPLASVAALFPRNEGEILGWTIWNCVLAAVIPLTMLFLVILILCVIETLMHPTRDVKLALVLAIGAIVILVLAVFATGVGAMVGFAGAVIRCICRFAPQWAVPKAANLKVE